MGNFITDMVRLEPTSLDQVRDSIIEALHRKTDLISLMKQHHDFLEESIAVLTNKNAQDIEKQMNLYRFFRLVEMHGKAEEEILYVELRNHSEFEARLEGHGGQDEHDLVFQLEAELLEMNYRSAWTEEVAAKAKVVACLVKHHLKEEESTVFPLAEKYLDGVLLDRMATNYIKKCQAYLDESASTSRIRPVRRLPVMENYLTPFF